MDCFECKVLMPDVKSMWKHFKYAHGFSRNSGFKCTFNGACDRKYDRYEGFLRHVKKEHFSCDQILIPDENRTNYRDEIILLNSNLQASPSSDLLLLPSCSTPITTKKKVFGIGL